MKDLREIEISIDWQFVLLLTIIAFIGRLLYIFTLESGLFYFDDSLQWNQMALNIIAGKGVIIDTAPTAYRMPLYSFFLAGIYKVFGAGNLFAVRVIQAVISALTCFFVYLITIAVFAEDEHAHRVGRIAAIISAFYPFFVYYSGAVLTETLYIFLLCLFMWLLITRKYAWASLVFGGVIMCRAEIAGFLIFILVGLFVLMKARDALGTFVVVLALVCAVLSPWAARNYMAFGRFVPLSTMGGWTFWEGNNPRNTTGGPCSYFPDTTGMDEVQRDKYLRNETLKVIRQDPGRFALLCLSKFKRFWNIGLNTEDPRYFSKRNNMISMLSFGPVLLLFIPGLMLTYWNRKNLMFIYYLILYTMLVNLAFVSSLRYRLPIEPYLIIFASYTISSVYRGKK